MPNTERIARGTNRISGRLVALSQAPLIIDTNAFNNDLAIDFPSMPDVIELARSADYNVTYNPVLPDGLHVYRGTKPMDIPFSFRLHAFDENYCPQGALTLLKIAARLHAFVLPLATDPSGWVNPVEKQPPPGANGQPAAGQGTETEVAHDAANNAEYQTGMVNGKRGAFYPPVAAWLHLMWIDDGQPGISCFGYVREVSVKFMGPWLRGQNGAFNLPSAADYSFTFVHRPGHSNSFATLTTTKVQPPTSLTNATADRVKNQLYNTYRLAYNPTWRGFAEYEKADSPLPTTPPAAVPPQNPQPQQGPVQQPPQTPSVDGQYPFQLPNGDIQWIGPNDV